MSRDIPPLGDVKIHPNESHGRAHLMSVMMLKMGM